MSRRDEYESRIRRFLARHSITAYRIEPRRKHQAVVVAHAGRKIVVMIPATPSDRRGALNAVADLRRQLRLAGAARQ
jgi:hypothetical protein